MLILVESAEGGREVAKKTVHVGRITKIVDCIRIVFDLPYNFDDLKAIRANPFSYRNVCCVTVLRYKSGVMLQNQTHSWDIVSTNCKQDDLKQSSV